ncbi:hypothetical protein DZC30_10655 [Comamonas testosteroni]|uniref:Uncharacterized protein n=1 Tax=Comamonas testosteroni TaxID=285 RepID=A0A373FMP5_COMTE|nr:hypothetical protein DZC30_10655 [Comamonas testosteroni]
MVLLGAPHALSRGMAHALLQAQQEAGLQGSWQCLAPQADEPWPADALVYVLGQDWRDADPDPAIAQQISRWREQLARAGQSYVMLYGKPSTQWLQLAESLKSIAPSLNWTWISSQNPWKPGKKMRRKACEQCGDPECEKQLFEALRKHSA